MILLTINIVLFAILCLFIFICRNLYIQNSKYEAHIENISLEFFKILDNTREEISQTLQHMRDIDEREMFEKDDDVGAIFEELSGSIEELNTKLKIYDQETEEN